jgi:hypothetical protein
MTTMKQKHTKIIIEDIIQENYEMIDRKFRKNSIIIF